MQIGDQVLFKGYMGNPAGYEPVLAPGDSVIVDKIDGEGGLRVRKVPAQPRRTVTEWVFPEEVMTPGERTGPNDPRPDPRKIFRIMANRDTKRFVDLRDRVAYMYVTGAHPTHLHSFFTGALNVVGSPCSASGRFGPFLIDSSAIYSLELNDHPMVIEARRLMREGWRLAVSLGPNDRRPFGALYFSSGPQRVTVNAEGWVKQGWPRDWTTRSTRR